MQIKIPDYVEKVLKALEEAGYECYVVGGAIRSALLNIEPNDYDLTTNALPDNIQEVFKNYNTIPTGIKHGTLTVISDGHPIEITTYRKDEGYEDHRHPNKVTFSTSLEEDCARRDFTMNALSYNPKDGIIDFFGGQEDIENKLVRSIGDPYQRLEEDALRILRALRFSSQLNFSIEEKTRQALIDKKEDLDYISTERIHEELNAFFRYPASSNLFNEYKDIFEIVIPELKEIDSWDKCIEALKNATGDEYVRIAIVLSFINNPKGILKRLTYSNHEQQQILYYINHKENSLTSKKDILYALKDDDSYFPSYVSFKKAFDSSIDEEKILSLYQEIKDKGDCYSLKDLKIDGTDVMNLGYKGKNISTILEECLNGVIEEKVSNQKEDLIEFIKAIAH